MPEAATATPPPQPTGQIQDAYADLDAMVSAGPQESTEQAPPESGATDAGKPLAEKPSTSKPEKAKSDSSVPDAGLKKTEPKPGETQSKPKPQPAAQLRQAYEEVKAKNKALEAENIRLKSYPPEDPEKKTLSERLTEREKRLADLENEIKFARYESSQEYKDKYEQPFVDAYQQGRSKASSLKVTDGEGAVRQGTPEDFDRIARLVDDDQAAELANEMFGAKAPVVLYHRERVQELNGARVKAIEDFRKLGSEREKQWREHQQKTTEAVGKLWTQANSEAAEKYPQWFKPADGDDEANKVLEEGFKLADKGFSDAPDLTPEQRVRLHSAIRNRAAGFGRLALLNKRLTAEVAELKEKLKQFEDSEPGAGDGQGKPAAPQGDNIDSVVAGLDALAR